MHPWEMLLVDLWAALHEELLAVFKQVEVQSLLLKYIYEKGIFGIKSVFKWLNLPGICSQPPALIQTTGSSVLNIGLLLLESFLCTV